MPHLEETTPMRSGFKDADIPASTDAKSVRAERLSEDRGGPVFSLIEVYAPEEGFGVRGNTNAVWVGGQDTSAIVDYEAGVDLKPGDSYPFMGVRLYDIWMAAITDRDRVTWIAYQ